MSEVPLHTHPEAGTLAPPEQNYRGTSLMRKLITTMSVYHWQVRTVRLSIWSPGTNWGTSVWRSQLFGAWAPDC